MSHRPAHTLQKIRAFAFSAPELSLQQLEYRIPCTPAASLVTNTMAEETIPDSERRKRSSRHQDALTTGANTLVVARISKKCNHTKNEK